MVQVLHIVENSKRQAHYANTKNVSHLKLNLVKLSGQAKPIQIQLHRIIVIFRIKSA